MSYVELSSVDVSEPGGEKQSGGETRDERTAPVARRRLWAVARVLLALWVAVALYFAWARWGRFDPVTGSSQARERVDLQISPTEHPWYFPMLLLHVIAASIAISTVLLQVWPRLRTRHPRVHRSVGRIYIFAGVYPAAFFALVVEAFWPFSVSTSLSQIVLALLWAFVTTVGYVYRRKGVVEEHRRWMLRSFALSVSVLVELAINPLIERMTYTQFYSRLDGNEDIFLQVATINENWFGLLIVILTVEGFLERDRLRAARRLAAASGKSTGDAAAPLAPAP